jgi:hypothetical protein
MKKVFLMLVSMMVLTACSEDLIMPTDTNPVRTVSINQISRVLYVGDTVTLSATVSGQDDAVVSWGVSTDLDAPTQVNVTLSSTGFLQVLRAGTTRVIASAGNKSDTLFLRTSLLSVRSVVVSADAPVQVGRATQLTAQLFDARALPLGDAQRTFRWEVTNPATDMVDTTIARVTESGVVTGRSIGTARIRLVVDGQASGSTDVVVGLLPVDYVTIAPDTVRVAVQGTRQVTARAFAADSTQMGTVVLHTRTWAWTVGNTAVAAVSSTGLVTGISAGTTTVTATIGGASQSRVVIVE